jgi:hypothetical protein
MNTPRFTVGSVTGYPTGVKAHSLSPRHCATIWYVHDSAYGYRILKRFKGGRQGGTAPPAEEQARRLADKLDAGNAA